MNTKGIVKGLLLIATLGAIGFVVTSTEVGSMLDVAWIDDHIRGQGITGMALYVGVAALFASVGVPRQVVSFMGGYAFGLLDGTGLAWLATVLGCVISFSFARLVGRDFIAGRLSGRVKKVEDFLSDNPFSMAVFIRILPAGSNLLTSICAGVCNVSAVRFVAGSALGFIPQSFIFALAGAGVNLDPVVSFGLSAVLLIVAAFIGTYLYRRFRHGKSVAEAADLNL